jgi:hypothetical protein
MRWLDTHGGWCAMVLAIICLIVWTMVLTGCGEQVQRSPVEPQPVGVSATLSDIGNTLAWAGGIGAAAGVALSLVALFVPALAPFAALFRFAAIGGAGVTGTGAAAIWLSDNLWLLVLAVAASLGAVLWWYWPAIRRAWLARMDAAAEAMK